MELVIDILKYTIGGLALGASLFIIIYYIIWFIVSVINQIKNVD